MSWVEEQRNTLSAERRAPAGLFEPGHEARPPRDSYRRRRYFEIGRQREIGSRPAANRDQPLQRRPSRQISAIEGARRSSSVGIPIPPPAIVFSIAVPAPIIFFAPPPPPHVIVIVVVFSMIVAVSAILREYGSVPAGFTWIAKLRKCSCCGGSRIKRSQGRAACEAEDGCEKRALVHECSSLDAILRPSCRRRAKI